MTRTLVNLITVDVGEATTQEQTARLVDLLGNLRSQSGVQGAGYTSYVPMSRDASRTGVGIESRPPDPNDAAPAHWRRDTWLFREHADSGRFPTDVEAENRAPVAVITRTTAERYWPGVDPIAQRLRILTPEWREIIGVVENECQSPRRVSTSSCWRPSRRWHSPLP